MSFLGLTEWRRARRARQAGRIDGRKAIPAPGEAQTPKYLELICAEGQRLIDSLELRFQHLDANLNERYRVAAVLYGQRTEAMMLALERLEEARKSYADKPTERRKVRLREAEGGLLGARRRAEAAERKLERIIARRIARYKQFCSACLCENQSTGKHMQEYAVANLREREDLPPGLAEAARPRLSLPELSGLEWDPALAVARAGKARGGRFAPALPAGATVRPPVAP